MQLKQLKNFHYQLRSKLIELLGKSNIGSVKDASPRPLRPKLTPIAPWRQSTQLCLLSFLNISNLSRQQINESVIWISTATKYSIDIVDLGVFPIILDRPRRISRTPWSSKILQYHGEKEVYLNFFSKLLKPVWPFLFNRVIFCPEIFCWAFAIA